MWFNQSSFECNVNFELIGTLLALAIYNSVHLDLKFPRIVYKKLAGEKATLEDLQEFEPEIYTTLRNISLLESGFEDMGLTFSVDYDYFGAVQTQELVPGGKDKEVTKENKSEFVQLYVDWVTTLSIEKQFTPFHKGFFKVITKESIRVPNSLTFLAF